MVIQQSKYKPPYYPDLWDEYHQIRRNEGEDKAKEFLNSLKPFVVWHGTRRKESLDDIRHNGICTYTPLQAYIWIDEAVDRAKRSPHLRSKRTLDIRAKYVKESIIRPERMTLYVTAFEDDAASWAYRNPEFIYDVLWSVLPENEWSRILYEMFGPCVKITVNIKLKVVYVIGVPQNIPSEYSCFQPNDILNVEYI